VSIKNYEISVPITYSVRGLIYDIPICARAAMTQFKRKIKQMTSALHFVTINFSKLWIPIHTFL